MPLMVVQPFRVKPKVAALIKSVDMSPLVFVPLLYGQLALLSCSHASTIRDLDGEGSLRNCSGGGTPCALSVSPPGGLVTAVHLEAGVPRLAVKVNVYG